MAAHWRPDADLSLLRARGEMLASVRGFFAERGVLEVETPLLCQAAVTDPAIMPMRQGARFLQTSPEFAMKRLLAAGSGPIYQVCKAFREGESGARHNPEFSMLEWYRPGFDREQLMLEVAELVGLFLPGRSWHSVSYRELFQRRLSLDPWTAPTGALEACARAAIDIDFGRADREQWLDLLLSHVLEPELAKEGTLFLCDFPPGQCALARLKQEGGIQASDRFELYVDGMELANGYVELTDARELAARQAADRAVLAGRGEMDRRPDERLLAAMEQGLPDCCGVALGLDRLLMLARGCERIEQVLAFGWEHA